MKISQLNKIICTHTNTKVEIIIRFEIDMCIIRLRIIIYVYCINPKYSNGEVPIHNTVANSLHTPVFSLV